MTDSEDGSATTDNIDPTTTGPASLTAGLDAAGLTAGPDAAGLTTGPGAASLTAGPDVADQITDSACSSETPGLAGTDETVFPESVEGDASLVSSVPIVPSAEEATINESEENVDEGIRPKTSRKVPTGSKCLQLKTY